MILVFPKTYITILPALYFLKLDHFPQVSSHRLVLSCPHLVSPRLIPPQHPRLILPCRPHLTLSCRPRRTSPCRPRPISSSHPWPVTNHQLASSTRNSFQF